MKKNAAIIISRQSIRPCGNDKWIKNTAAAVEWIKSSGSVLYSSVGMSTWEIITTLALIKNVPLKLFIPCLNPMAFDENRDYLIEQFELNGKDVELIPVTLPLADPSPEKIIQARDKIIIEQADLLIPISIRNGGNLERHIKNFSGYGKNINNSFTCGYQKPKSKLAYRIDWSILNHDFINESSNYLIHWTKSQNNKWPNEKQIDYYKAVIASDIYPRKAFDNLINIFKSNTIFSSNKNIQGSNKVVSFSSQTPDKMIELMRWRSRYNQMSFEPYGIAIEKEFAQSKNIQKVKYYDKKQESPSADENNWLYQSQGTLSDWRVELEYRHLGDFDIKQIPENKIAFVTRTKKEADLLNAKTGIKTFAFTTE